MVSPSKHINRFVEARVREALAEVPVTVLEGARQVGKSTIVNKICEEVGGLYLTLDVPNDRYQLTNELEDVLSEAGQGRLVVIDEIQRMPSLIVDIKGQVDKAKRPGMFLLTGSGDRYSMVIDKRPLAGRCWSISIGPLSQAEILSSRSRGGRSRKAGKRTKTGRGIVAAMISGDAPDIGGGMDLAAVVALGGYPPCVVSPGRKRRWMMNYYQDDLSSLISQTTRSQSLVAMDLFLEHVSKRIGKQVNLTDIAKEMGETDYAAKLLYDLICDTYVLEPLAGMRRKPGKRKVAVRPKLYLNDTGLATTILGLDGSDLTKAPRWGALVENFVLSEIRKDLALNHPAIGFNVQYFLEHNGIDVDIVLSCGSQHGLIPIEVKAAGKVRPQDIRHLYDFKRRFGKECGRGYVLYNGDEVVEFVGGIQAWPISCLWSA